jgi:hypothetical protein
MTQSIKNRMASLSCKSDALELRKLMEATLADMTAMRSEMVKLVTDVTTLITREKNQTLSSCGLAIGSGSKLTAQVSTPFAYLANGVMMVKAIADCSSLVGTIADGKTAGWAFYIDSAGTITTSTKTADAAGNDATGIAATYTLLKAIAVPSGKTLIGYLLVGTTGATFVGGTTALDAVTATDTYLSLVGPASVPTAITAVAPAALTTLA